MTITKTSNKAQANGNGVTVAFSFPYRFFAESDLGVYVLSAAGVETKQTLTTHYTVSNTGTEDGGTVTFLTAPASGELITIVGEIPYTQTADYTPNDAFPAETHEAALDRGVRLTQRVQEVISRAIIAPVSDTSDLELPDAATRAGKYLYFNPITGDVSAASSGSLTGPVSFLGFTNSAYTVGIGELAWNDTDKTLDLGMTSSVTQQIGQEVLHYCKNNSGVAIANGQVVRVTGASGNALTIALADATDAVTATSTVGVATEDIADNASGMVTMIGLVRGIDTSAFTEGDTLYLSETAGALTATSPVYPAQSIKVAVVVRDHATMGSIFVHVENMQSDKQPFDADLTALAGLASAGMIARTGAGTVEARTLTPGTGISISNGDGVLGNPTITAGAAGWEAYNTTGDGKFYDFAVHGAVASVETPTFADGYEYMIIAESFGKGVSGAALTFQIELYRNQAAAYAGAAAFFLTTGTAALSVTGFVALYLPRRTVRSHYIIGHMATDTTNTTTGGGLFYNMVNHTTATKIGKARVSWSTAALSTSGKLYLYRRILA